MEVKRFDSLEEISCADWDACFPGVLENYGYLLALEKAKLEGFRCAYFAAYEDGRLLAAVPAFYTLYDLATTADGVMRGVLNSLQKVTPKLVKLKLACVGSVEAERCPLGIHPAVEANRRGEVLATLLAAFEEDAKANGILLLGIKDLSDIDCQWAGDTLQSCGYTGVAGMPGAQLAIDFGTMEAYLSRLSRETRKDMRRKLRAKPDVTVEWRTHIDDVIQAVHTLYLETKVRSEWQFGELSAEYFTGILRHMPSQSICALYYAEGKLAAFNILLYDGQRLLDKFFCMDRELGRAYNLYFLSWFTNIQFCLDKGIKLYQSGQAAYGTKLRLGSSLAVNNMYFRHENRIANAALRLLAPMLAFDEPERKAA